MQPESKEIRESYTEFDPFWITDSDCHWYIIGTLGGRDQCQLIVPHEIYDRVRSTHWLKQYRTFTLLGKSYRTESKKYFVVDDTVEKYIHSHHIIGYLQVQKDTRRSGNSEDIIRVELIQNNHRCFIRGFIVFYREMGNTSRSSKRVHLFIRNPLTSLVLLAIAFALGFFLVFGVIGERVSENLHVTMPRLLDEYVEARKTLIEQAVVPFNAGNGLVRSVSHCLSQNSVSCWTPLPAENHRERR